MRAQQRRQPGGTTNYTFLLSLQRAGVVMLLSTPLPTTAVAQPTSTQPAADSGQASATTSDDSLDAGVPDQAAPLAPRRPLQVAVAGSAPFVIPHSHRRNADGFSMDVLHLLSEEARLSPDVTLYSQIPAALEAVRSGHADLAIGPISVTAARAAQVQFLQPYYVAPVGILTRLESNLTARFAPFLTQAFGLGVTTLSLVLMLVGVIVWLAERKANPDHFPRALLPGVANGMWFALVTMTTVGYGDRAPITPVGRMVTGIWMVVAMLTASSLTAGIASALTLSQIDSGRIHSIQDLAGHTVAAVPGTPSMAIARRHGADVVRAQSKSDGLRLLQERTVAAFLYDLPVLSHYQEQHPELPLRLVRTDVEVDNYAFAVSLDSPLSHQLDVALIALKERGELRALEERWLP